MVVLLAGRDDCNSALSQQKTPLVLDTTTNGLYMNRKLGATTVSAFFDFRVLGLIFFFWLGHDDDISMRGLSGRPAKP